MDVGAWIVAHEGQVRFAIFALVFTLFAIAEAWRPAMPRVQSRFARWKANLGLGLTSSLALRILLPGAAILAAVFAQMRGWGVLNALELPGWLEIVLAIAVLDAAIYLQHVLTHRVPILWRLHQVHHSDREVDVSTALRFHPAEIVLSQIYKIAIVLALGAAPLAVVAYEVLLNATAIFNHSNLKHSMYVDRFLRAILVTPDMHRIHHSQVASETNSNYGNALSIWDRLFRTYRSAPASTLVIGLESSAAAPTTEFLWAIQLPFRTRA